jgi:hypothetical protein
MSQIEDLLRDALVTAPTPATSTVDPLSDLGRRVGRARMRRRGIAVVAVITVVLAIVLPLSLRSSPVDRHPSPTSGGHVTKLPTHVGGAITSGGGSVWSLRQDFRHSDASTGAQDGIVAQRVPGTLQVERTYRVPGPVDFIAYGLNRVWVWGGGDGGYPDAQLSVISLDSIADRHVATVPFGHGRPIGDLVFAGGRAWVLGLRPSQLIPVSMHGLHVAFGQPVAAPQATQAAAGNGTVYALSAPVSTPSGPQDTVVAVDATTGDPVSAPHADGHVNLVLPSGFLVVRQHRLVTENSQGDVVGSMLPGRVSYATAVPDTARGVVYVLTAGAGCLNDGCDRLLEYSVSDLARGTASPRAEAPLTPRGEIFSVAADPSGALLFTNGASAFRWVPPR